MKPRREIAEANPTNDAQRQNIARAAEKAADAKVRALPMEHPTMTAYRWNQMYWSEWGERMEAAGLRPWHEKGRPGQSMETEQAIRVQRAA